MGEPLPKFSGQLCRIFYIETSSKTMADQQKLVTVVDTGDLGFFVLEDQSMNGSNGFPLVIGYAEDRLRPTEDSPTHSFYIYAPVLHWHQSPTTDEPAHRAIEQLAQEAF